jgi:hypothetical protein
MRKLFISVTALDGPRARESSSSSLMGGFRLRSKRDVFRPPRVSSGSSESFLLDLNSNDDLLPAWGSSSGSSVAVRRIRAKSRDDFRPAVDSSGVVGAVV